jgi:hypothetical protein
MSRDKTFVDEAERLGLDVSPIDADAVLKLLVRLAATPREVIARYNALGAKKN